VTRRPSSRHFIDAADRGDTKLVQDLLARGANLHARRCDAIVCAARKGHADIVAILLAHGAHPRTEDDLPIRVAAMFDHPTVVKLLTAAIFSPDLWRGKTLADIQAEAEIISQRIYRPEPQHPKPRYVKQAELILFDYAMTCWEHVRPDPPKIHISDTPAKGRAL
jgi:hypothetical protein